MCNALFNKGTDIAHRKDVRKGISITERTRVFSPSRTNSMSDQTSFYKIQRLKQYRWTCSTGWTSDECLHKWRLKEINESMVKSNVADYITDTDYIIKPWPWGYVHIRPFHRLLLSLQCYCRKFQSSSISRANVENSNSLCVHETKSAHHATLSAWLTSSSISIHSATGWCSSENFRKFFNAAPMLSFRQNSNDVHSFVTEENKFGARFGKNCSLIGLWRGRTQNGARFVPNKVIGCPNKADGCPTRPSICLWRLSQFLHDMFNSVEQNRSK